MSNFHAPTDNVTALLLGPAWAMTALSTIFVAMRVICRLKYNQLWWDDFWMSVTLMCAWAMAILWSIYASMGGTSYAPLPYEQTAKLQLVGWISKAFCIACLTISKVAITAFILRLQAPTRWRTILLYVLNLICILWNGSNIILIFTQCSPSYKLWDPLTEGHCLPPTAVVYNALGGGSFLAFMDLALVAIPAHMIWQLQMPLKRKITVACLLGTGVFAFAMAIVKITFLPIEGQRGADLIHLDVLSYIWNAAEANVVIIAGCVPAIVPLWEVMRGRTPKPEYKQPTHIERPARPPPPSTEGSKSWFRRYGFDTLMTQHGKTTELATVTALDGDSDHVVLAKNYKTDDSRWDKCQPTGKVSRDHKVTGAPDSERRPSEGIYVTQSVDVTSERDVDR